MPQNNILDEILSNYYQSLNNAINGNNSDKTSAIDNICRIIELGLKLYYNLSKTPRFTNLTQRLRQETPRIVSNTVIEEVELAYSLRNKIIHDPKINLVTLKEVNVHAANCEILISKLFNRSRYCLFLPSSKDGRHLGLFLKCLNDIEKNLSLFYKFESDILNPEDFFKACLDLAYFQGILNEEVQLLEIIKNFKNKLFQGLLENPINELKKYIKDLRDIRKVLRLNLIYFYENYDARLR